MGPVMRMLSVPVMESTLVLLLCFGAILVDCGCGMTMGSANDWSVRGCEASPLGQTQLLMVFDGSRVLSGDATD